MLWEHDLGWILTTEREQLPRTALHFGAGLERVFFEVNQKISYHCSVYVPCETRGKGSGAGFVLTYFTTLDIRMSSWSLTTAPIHGDWISGEGSAATRRAMS